MADRVIGLLPRLCRSENTSAFPFTVYCGGASTWLPAAVLSEGHEVDMLEPVVLSDGFNTEEATSTRYLGCPR